MSKKRCGAKTRSGEPCQAYAMDNGRCRMHGGKAHTGAALPQFRSGRYSKYLPERLAARYQEAQADGELLALRDEVALLDARLSEVLEGAGTGNSAELWKRLREAFAELMKAQAQGNSLERQRIITEILSIIQQGGDEYAAWAEVYELLERRRRLVESERKRLVEMQMMISSERAMVMLAMITDTIRKHVSDKSALAAIAADLRKLTVVEPGG